MAFISHIATCSSGSPRWRGNHGYVPSVLTFDPHPTRVVAPDRAPKLLSKPEQRFEWMANAGIERIFLLPFNRNFAELTPEEFVEHVLVDTMRAKAVLVGANFRFGNRQRGDTTLLMKLGREVRIHAPRSYRAFGCAAAWCRAPRCGASFSTGNVSMACRLLGRPYALEGRGSAGFRRSAPARPCRPSISRPTRRSSPLTGVYITRTDDLDTGRSPGPRLPTSATGQPSEAHR